MRSDQLNPVHRRPGLSQRLCAGGVQLLVAVAMARRRRGDGVGRAPGQSARHGRRYRAAAGGGLAQR